MRGERKGSDSGLTSQKGAHGIGELDDLALDRLLGAKASLVRRPAHCTWLGGVGNVLHA